MNIVYEFGRQVDLGLVLCRAGQSDNPFVGGDLSVEHIRPMMIQQGHPGLGRDGSVIDYFALRPRRLMGGVVYGHLVVHIFDSGDIFDVFSRELLLCLA